MANKRVTPAMSQNPLEQVCSQQLTKKNRLNLFETSNKYRLRQQIKQLENSNMFRQNQIKINKVSQTRAQISLSFTVSLPQPQLPQPQNSPLSWSQPLAAPKVLQFIILLHESYPWKQPLLLCATQIMFPRLDDYRDYLEDVIQGQWWPNVTLLDIVKALGIFVRGKLMGLAVKGGFDLGSRGYLGVPQSLAFINKYSKGLKICKAQYFNTEDVLMGKYQNIVLGVCWNDIVLFKLFQQRSYKLKDKKNDKQKDKQGKIQSSFKQSKWVLTKKWLVRQIKKLSSKKIKSKKYKRAQQKVKIQIKGNKIENMISENKQNNTKKVQRVANKSTEQDILIQVYQFCIELMNGKKQYIKIQTNPQQSIDPQQQPTSDIKPTKQQPQLIEQMSKHISINRTNKIAFSDENNQQIIIQQEVDKNQIRQDVDNLKNNTGILMLENSSDISIKPGRKSNCSQDSRIISMNSISKLNASSYRSRQEAIFDEEQMWSQPRSSQQPITSLTHLHQAIRSETPTHGRLNSYPAPATQQCQSSQTSIQTLRHIIQYIQLRQCVLGGDQCFESKIRMLSQVIENAADLEAEVELQAYYQFKLKEIICYEFMGDQDTVTSKFQFDI